MKFSRPTSSSSTSSSVSSKSLQLQLIASSSKRWPLLTAIQQSFLFFYRTRRVQKISQRQSSPWWSCSRQMEAAVQSSEARTWCWNVSCSIEKVLKHVRFVKKAKHALEELDFLILFEFVDTFLQVLRLKGIKNNTLEWFLIDLSIPEVNFNLLDRCADLSVATEKSLKAFICIAL